MQALFPQPAIEELWGIVGLAVGAIAGQSAGAWVGISQGVLFAGGSCARTFMGGTDLTLEDRTGTCGSCE